MDDGTTCYDNTMHSEHDSCNENNQVNHAYVCNINTNDKTARVRAFIRGISGRFPITIVIMSDGCDINPNSTLESRFD